jgi:superfamily II DNA or RNA helicase
LVEAPTGVGKTRIALEFVRRRGGVGLLWLSLGGTRLLTGFTPPRKRMQAVSSSKWTSCLITAVALNNILGRIDLDSFWVIIFDETHKVVALWRNSGSTGTRFTTSNSS